MPLRYSTRTALIAAAGADLGSSAAELSLALPVSDSVDVFASFTEIVEWLVNETRSARVG